MYLDIGMLIQDGYLVELLFLLWWLLGQAQLRYQWSCIIVTIILHLLKYQKHNKSIEPQVTVIGSNASEGEKSNSEQ